MLIILAISAGAGIIGTGLGGLIGIFFGSKSEKALSGILSFSAGVMISIVCFDLIPEAITISQNIYFVLAATASGILMVVVIGNIVDKLNINRKKILAEKKNIANMVCLQPNLIQNGTNSLYRAGLVMLLAIALHNLPEGMAIGAGSSYNQTKGAMLALLIAIHNIPEGMSIAAPLCAGGMNKVKAVLLASVSGGATILGGIIGYLISSVNLLFTAISLAFAGGAMLFVTFGEIIPEAISADKNRSFAFFTIIGILFGIYLCYLLI